VVKEVINAWGRLDVLINNAGIRRDPSVRKVAEDEWSDVINVNLNGTYYCTSAALPWMMQQKFGRIVNIMSHFGHPGCGSANQAGKGGVGAYTKTVALDMARHNITVNSIAPGFTCTETLEAVPAEILDQIKAKIPMGRLASPQEIARAVGFLAAEADYMTGQQLNISGGLHMV
jgi:NAD(P)-dependent dehydrogenase (short-subunit alcohol dehydrogenase family)